MEQIGVVIKVDGENAVVNIKRTSACGGSCNDCAGCETTEQQFEVINHVGAKVGQIVKIEMKDSYILFSAFLLYIIPLVMFFIGYAVGYSIFPNELAGGMFGLLLLALSYVIIKMIDRKYIRNNKHRKAVITRIIGM